MAKYPHFRRYKRSKHPALILSSAKKTTNNDSYLYRKTSHSPKLTSRGYEKVYPNPNPKDPNPMYIENKKRVDYKNQFGPDLGWKYKKNK